LNKFSKDLLKSLGEAADHAEGRASSARIHMVEVPDVRAIRRKLHLSQQEFVSKYRIPLLNAEKLGAGKATAGRAGGGLPPRDRVPPSRNQRSSEAVILNPPASSRMCSSSSSAFGG
jgi:hypothetical protein